MPNIEIPEDILREWGHHWLNASVEKHGDKPNCFVKKDAMDFPKFFDARVASSLATMLGDVPVITPNRNSLLPPEPNCVELGDSRIIGGIRPQNYDVCYRPDGVRFVFDSKSLNDADSLRKNYQNMINDLATEAATVHIRFPYAVVAFMVIVPLPILFSPQKESLSDTLERLSSRKSPLDSTHLAEAISFILWDPADGNINQDWPISGSCLRLELFSEQVQKSYFSRYKGLPPHA